MTAGWKWEVEVEREVAERTSRKGTLQGCDCYGKKLIVLRGELLPSGDLVLFILHCVTVEMGLGEGARAEEGSGRP